jgi:Ig-like domain-containing protein
MKGLLLRGVFWVSMASTLLRAQTPPPNDNFTNAILLTGTNVSFVGTLSNATFETGEPPFLPSQNPLPSVWWKWAPSGAGPVTLQITPDSPFPAGVAVWLEILLNAQPNPTYPPFPELSQIALTRIYGWGGFMTASLPNETNYYFRVSGNWQGSFSAQFITLGQPTFVQQPEDCTVFTYETAMFSALATGLPAPHYQWRFNGVPLAGETAPILLLYNVTSNQVGQYSVTASNSAGVVSSAPAWLSVTETNPLPTVTMLGPTNGSRVFFIVKGQPGRYYKSITTADLRDWTYGGFPIYGYGPATNVNSLFSTFLLNAQQQFVSVSLDSGNDGCIGQLKAFHSALRFYVMENQLAPGSSYMMQDLDCYFKSGTAPNCPGGGAYVQGGATTNDPSCTRGWVVNSYIGTFGHHWP